MSLDDAAVLAGLASDGVEFFQRLDRLETQGQALLASGAQPGADNANAGLRMNETNLRSTGDPDATPMPIGEAQAMGLAGPTASSSSSSSHPSQQQRGSLRTRSSTGGPVHGRTFSPHHPHSPSSPAEFATPGSTSKDAETRELRDFWKAYMRTPLTGPVGSPGMHGMGTGGHGMLSPSSTYSGSGNSYRRHRVSSLPSAKTPTALNDEQRFGNGAGTVGFNGYHDVGAYGQAPGAVSTSHQLQHQVSSHPHRGQAPVAEGAPLPPPPPAPSHMSTIHGNAEDLRSYEAAVLAHARTAPVNLNLSMQGKRRNKPNRFSAMGLDDSLSGGGATSSPASNPLSSLAKSQLLSATPLNASTRGAGTKTKPRLSQTPESGSPSSFTSGEEESSDSGSGEALVGASTASRRFSRPSYKRLASQNLEKGGSGKVARV
ncbi:hypothetical protein BT96DRAFT_507710 [Gymnopus androsaceus JB14]|uniref:Uncharacterized protein n=1 Tax=Gymnopus androsaceus JB14 TaxID=1447944 RepID=A0A6A4GM12_9AGAR|nr:hypothetical protein BT96DRAFT_507710 [Gymnopus androsaceus JB14]